MNILMVLSQLEVTGAEVYAVTLAKALAEKGHKLYIISDTLTVPSKAIYKSMPIAKRDIVQRFKNVRELIKFIREENINVVHAHSRASAWVSKLACLFCRIPLVVTVHGRQSTFLSRKIFRFFGDYTIAVCEEIQKQIVNDFHISKNKVEVLRNFFDADTIKYKSVENDKPIVSYITRFS